MTSKKGLTQHQRVFERLMAGETIEQIRKDISGSSALQRGIQAYNERMQKDIPELQRAIRELENSRKNLDDDLQRLSNEVKKKVSEKKDLGTKINKERKKLEWSKKRNVDESNRFNKMIDSQEELRKRGLTDKTVERIGKVDFGEGDELLERISTVEKYHILLN